MDRPERTAPVMSVDTGSVNNATGKSNPTSHQVVVFTPREAIPLPMKPAPDQLKGNPMNPVNHVLCILH